MRANPAVLYAQPAQKRCREICDEIVGVIRASPVTPRRTGELVAGYQVVVEPPGAEIVNVATNDSGEPYWQFVEFGTSEMQAEPHVRPAIEIVRKRHHR